MRLNASSGAKGQIIEFVQDSVTTGQTDGVVLVKRDEGTYPFEGRPYATWRLGEGADGEIVAMNGVYDMTLEEGRKNVRQRTLIEEVPR